MKYHGRKTQYYCSACDMGYDSKMSLKKHMIASHDAGHMCRECNKGFKKIRDLKIHEREHYVKPRPRRPRDQLAEAIPVICQFCGKRFCNRYALRGHLCKIHNFSTEAVKTLLRLRKTGKSPPKDVKYENSIHDDDENEKNFKVYYKDDEMAVFVKMGNPNNQSDGVEDDVAQNMNVNEERSTVADVTKAILGRKDSNSVFVDVTDTIDAVDHESALAIHGITTSSFETVQTTTAGEDSVIIVVPNETDAWSHIQSQANVAGDGQKQIVVVVNNDEEGGESEEYVYMATEDNDDNGSQYESVISEQVVETFDANAAPIQTVTDNQVKEPEIYTSYSIPNTSSPNKHTYTMADKNTNQLGTHNMHSYVIGSAASNLASLNQTTSLTQVTDDLDKFESVIVSKAAQFQNPEAYNEYLDKMMMTLLKAKMQSHKHF